MFTTGKELLAIANNEHKTIYQVVIEREMMLSNKQPDDIINHVRNNLAIMKSSSHKSLNQPQPTIGNMISGDSKKLYDYHMQNNALCGSLASKAMALALSSSEVNASMGLICAAPTAGSCGIVPAALLTVGEDLNCTDDELIHALLVATGIGLIITENATVSGAEGGCQAECGSAAAMGAGAVVYLKGGTNDMIFHAAAIALQNVMGLVCDPIAGIVESPCAKRNASGVVNAFASADMALAGIHSVIPFDEVVDAMSRVGQMMPHHLKETALGGIAVTPTGLAIKERIFG